MGAFDGEGVGIGAEREGCLTFACDRVANEVEHTATLSGSSQPARRVPGLKGSLFELQLFAPRYSLRMVALVLRSTDLNPAPHNAVRMAAGGTHSAIVAQ